MTATTAPTPLRESPLRAEHDALGAVLTDFAGWKMPVRYGSDLAEHHAVRRAAGLFDVSHMGELLVTGPGTGAFLDRALAGRLSALAVGRARYTMILAEDGGIVDDLIVYRLAEERYLVITNAGNRDAVREALAERQPRFAPGQESGDSETPDSLDAAVEDISDDLAMIAVQGPAAQAILAATAGIDQLGAPWAQQRAYAWTDAMFAGSLLLIARTGYTGEDGFELLVSNAHAPALWRALRAAGEPHGLLPAGLAVRDTLRLEAGMPLYGHELSRAVVPAQVGLGRVIPAGKTGFVGEAAARPRPEAPVLVGLIADGRRAGRAGSVVLNADEPVGEVTSGALSPTLGRPIAMAMVEPQAAQATGLTIDVRGTRIPAAVTELPFYRRKK